MIKAAVNKAPVVPPLKRDDAGNHHDARAIPTQPHARAQPRNLDAQGAVPFVERATRGSHWVPPDILGDILAIAWRAGAAEPVEIRLRPELHERLMQQMPDAAALGRGSLTNVGGIPLVVDEDLPAFPGYEIHRTPPRPSAREERPEGSDSGPDGADVARAA